MDIVKNSVKFVAVSAIFVLISLGLLFFSKLNLGIDMTGGIQMEYSYEDKINIEDVKQELGTYVETLNTQSNIINDTSVYSIT